MTPEEIKTALDQEQLVVLDVAGKTVIGTVEELGTFRTRNGPGHVLRAFASIKTPGGNVYIHIKDVRRKYQ